MNFDKATLKKVPAIKLYTYHVKKKSKVHPIFLTMYHFMLHFISSLVTWDVVILVLIILKTDVWLHDF